LLLALVVALALPGASDAFAISRATVLARAQVWIDRCVPYSQSHYYAGYRTDCSGFASMCWQTGTSWSTTSFHTVTSKITTAQLLPGDAMLKVNPQHANHIRIFYGWLDDAHTMYVAYEQTSSRVSLGTACNIKVLATDWADGYRPIRYNRIADAPASPNLLRNPSFDVWAVSRTAWTVGPVWWTVAGSRDATLTVRRKDVAKATRNSVALLNPSSSRVVYTTMTQEVTVTPEATYAVSAWARTACDPAGIDLSVAYLSASGGVLSTTHVRGDGSRVNAASFSPMTAFAVAPAGAVRALVTVRLAGGSTAISATRTVSGTSAIVDEISLLRPQAAIGIRTSVAHSHVGLSVTLSGPVTPSAAVGAAYVVYVRKPGSSVWTPCRSATAFASGGGAAWKCSYAFKRGMKPGVYRFKTVVPAFGHYLGCATGIARVTLK
jgi:hypothetical protein